MDEPTLSGNLIRIPYTCFLNAGDSFTKIFKKTCNCHRIGNHCMSCDICRKPIKHCTKRAIETIGFTVLGCVCIIPGAIGLVGYIPEKIVNVTLNKGDAL